MNTISSAVKVGILFLVMSAGTYGVFKTVSKTASGDSSFEVWARLNDAGGLRLNSRIMIAGLPVGELVDLSLEGRYAKVTMRLRDDVVLWDNAVVFKKSSSLLGSFYLEIDPGTPESVDALGKRSAGKKLISGQELTRVVEATSVDMLLRRMDNVLPKVDAVLLSVRDLSEDVRGVVNGPLASLMGRIDGLVQNEAGTVGSILARTDRTLARIESITQDIRGVTGDANRRVKGILDNLDQASVEARQLLKVAKQEVELTGGAFRERMDSLDAILDPTASVLKKIDEDEGTLGRLVNDSTIADNIEDITDDAKGFLGTLFGMQTYVGLRSEYSVLSGLGRHYVSVELRTRPDKFYYVELVQGARGGAPTTELEYDNVAGVWRRNVKIEDKLRFTFQFAKRYDWLTLRFGLKESTGGVGMDGAWFNNRLKLSADVFEATFDAFPRLKLSAAYEFFGGLYILAGVDDLLNSRRSIVPEPIGPDTPDLFEEIPVGRDYFLGAMLQFNDLDLTALLTVGGAALAGSTN